LQRMCKRCKVHKINNMQFIEKQANVNKMLKTTKKMFTITSFTTGSRRA
jgi:hypothetical protein